MSRRVLLIVLDGWGMAPASPGNAISLARKPNFDLFWGNYPHTLLAASGEAVGLPKGQIGGSEVGHLHLGAGRQVLQDLPRITKTINNGTFYKNQTLVETFKYAVENNKAVHFLGLVSPGGVHSHQNHLYALLEMAKREKVKEVFIHVFTDGRDVGQKSALEYIEKLERKIASVGVGKIATISGRYFAMDRDNRWDRTNLAYNALVLGRGELAKKAKDVVTNSYSKGINDEFIRPTILNQKGMIDDGDAAIFFNFRSDRTRQLTKSLIMPNFKGFTREKHLKKLFFITMTEYEEGLPVSGIVFPEMKITNTLSEIIAEEGLKQFHIAETEKFPHVTYFFNGLSEEKVEGEDRKMRPSPRVATYDLKPEMSAPQVAMEVTERLGKYDFILVNFANLDLVGHTGKIPEAIKAVETVDACLGGVVIAAKNAGYDIIVTADHGNAEKMLTDRGTPCTAHTTNPVPFILISKDYHRLKFVLDPMLGNVAPTILKIMNINKPIEMKESALIGKKEAEEEKCLTLLQ